MFDRVKDQQVILAKAGDSWNSLSFDENAAEVNLKLVELRNKLREAKNQSNLLEEKAQK